MPESEPETKEKSEKKAASQKSRKPPRARSAKWAIVLLSLLCAALLCTLFVVALLPRLVERKINSILQEMAEGGGAEFRLKSISLTSTEVACKLTDTTHGNRPLKVGSIGSLSIRYSPLPLLLDRTIESIDIENCDVLADYSDGTISIPAWNIFAGKFQSGEKQEKSDDSAPVNDLNAVVPVKIGRISLSGNLAAVARGENAGETLHISYSLKLQTDPEQDWNDFECLVRIRLETNAFTCRAHYWHNENEKMLALNIADLSLSTFTLPRAIRSALPRGFRAEIRKLTTGNRIDLIDLNNAETKPTAENTDVLIDLNELDAVMKNRPDKGIEVAWEALNAALKKMSIEGNVSFGYRPPREAKDRPDAQLRIEADTPFSLKTVPRIIPTVKPMNPPKTENHLVFTLGSLKGEYDEIPFELGGIEVRVSPRHRTLQGSFQLGIAESGPAEFSFGGGMDEDKISLNLALENKPLLQVKYMGADVSCRPEKITAELRASDDGIHVKAPFSIQKLQAGIDGRALNPELKGLTASLKPELVAGEFRMDGSRMEAAIDISGGDVSANYKGSDVSCRPEKITAELRISDDGIHVKAPFSIQEFQAGIDGRALNPELKGLTASLKPELVAGEFRMDGSRMEASFVLSEGEYHAEYNGMEVMFKPESFRAETVFDDGLNKASAEIREGKLSAEFNGMTFSADQITFKAESEDGRKFHAAVAKINDFQFKQHAAGLTYEAPELRLENTSFDLGGNVLSGEIVCEESRLAMPELKLLAQKLRWEFPFDYSFAEANTGGAENEENAENAPVDASRTGKISLGDFEFNGIQAASLDGTLQWDDAAKALHLKTDAKLLSIDGQIYADVVLGKDGVETECGIVIPEQDADLSKDLAKFFPQIEVISCTGKVKGNAVYKLLPKTTTGRAEFRIADADILVPDKKLEVHGIDLGFEIPEIAVMKSAPGQTLTFKSVKYDKIETGPGRATFRMEAPDTWQIENALLDWCGGHIRLGGVTYRMGQTTTEAVLYCDRLDLPVFLSQIGAGQISGRGSINGTIPIVIVQKEDAFGKTKIDNVYFEDAFLFSTPGEDGLIMGEFDEALMNAGSGMEMELAKDALKDFTYSWVRMRMLSTGPDKENLRLELQLDGHPNRLLYYSFDEKTASFMKSPTPCKFQGIRLDTNVNMYGKAMELVDYFQQIFAKGN